MVLLLSTDVKTIKIEITNILVSRRKFTGRSHV